MISNKLSTYFAGAAGKVLSAVETDPTRSHQHEFNAPKALRRLLGEPDSADRYAATFVYLTDDLLPTLADASVTMYDARGRGRAAGRNNRSEYRLYFQANPVVELARESDYLVIAKAQEGAEGVPAITVIVCPAGSSVAAQVQDLFGLRAEQLRGFDVAEELQATELTVTSRALLEALGLETGRVREDLLEGLLSEFPDGFPTTSDFSRYARRTAGETDPVADPDHALLSWWDHEATLFQTLERHHLMELFKEAADDVDRVLEIAKSAFNRRMSRAGQALENHIDEILSLHGLSFARGVRTEGTKKPDFLFPGQAKYQDPSFPADSLRMLGSKTTCKDRWRQVLVEADRIPRKHLLTLEAPISVTQTAEMAAQGLTLVVPRAYHSHYTPEQQQALYTFSDFIAEVAALQKHQS